MKEVFYWRCFIQPPVATVFTALSLFYAYAVSFRFKLCSVQPNSDTINKITGRLAERLWIRRLCLCPNDDSLLFGQQNQRNCEYFFSLLLSTYWIFFLFILLNFQHEALLLALWRTKWYALPLAEQKMFILLLQQVQNGPVLTIGPYSVLDFGTAFDVSIKHIKPQSC